MDDQLQSWYHTQRLKGFVARKMGEIHQCVKAIWSTLRLALEDNTNMKE